MVPLKEVVDHIESGDQGFDVWALEPYFETDSHELAAIFLSWLRERPHDHDEVILELLCKHALYDPELGPSVLEVMKNRLERGFSSEALARALEHGVYKLGEASPWQQQVIDFALTLADTSAEARDYLRFPAWSMLRRDQASEWAPAFFREIVNRIDSEGSLLATLDDLIAKTHMPFQKLWPHVIYISRKIDGAPYGPSLLFAAMKSDLFMDGLCKWLETHSPGSLSETLEDFRLALVDERYLALLTSTLEGKAARYFKVFSGRDGRRAAAIASFMVWRKVEWPEGTAP